ncbi:MAG: hypothetical protein GF411_16540 [Candidatus Lokiarchaeota archaeon]|nr:hypothetical protein [Candidatus Lokiarchaeota archaeon]
MSVRPDYQNESLVNLSCAVSRYLGNATQYTPMDIDGVSLELCDKSVLLLVLDGMGYNYFLHHIHSGPLRENLRVKLTSVFPASTGSAITSLFTATAPLQHGITGWYVYLKQLGVMTQFLPFITLANDHPMDLEVAPFIGSPSIVRNPQIRSITIQPKDIVHSKYSTFLSGDSYRVGCKGLGNLVDTLSYHLSRSGKKFIYAYHGNLDHLAHEYGCQHEKTIQHLHQMDEKISTFLEHNLPDDTIVLITADHGLIDTTPETRVYGADHPELMDSLIMPVCGDTRSGYCYVRPSKVDRFLNYIDDNLSYACDVKKSTDLVTEGWFGLDEPSSVFDGRIGDYVLMMKDNHAFLNSFPGHEREIVVGHHGGTTEDEMYVPLILFER